jgi:hypothetical protein
MYTLTIGKGLPGEFTLTFRGLLEAAEAYKLLVAHGGLNRYMVTAGEPDGIFDMGERLDGMARLFAGTPAQVTDDGWWND